MAPRDAPDDAEEARLSALDERLAKYHRLYASSDVDDLYYRATRDIVVAGRRWRKLANERIRPTGRAVHPLSPRPPRDTVGAGRRWRKLANERIRPTGHTMARWETLFLVA